MSIQSCRFRLAGYEICPLFAVKGERKTKQKHNDKKKTQKKTQKTRCCH